MKKRLFLYTTLIITAGLLCFFASSVYITYRNNLGIAKDTVAETAQICADLYSDGADVSAFTDVPGNTRITLISPEGEVLADSRPLDPDALENHLNRPEIQSALNGAPEPCVRYSETLGTDLIYYALKAERGDGYVFIRAAVPVAQIDAYLLQALPLFAVLLLLVALLSLAFSRGMIKRLTKPLESVERKLRLLSSGEYAPMPAAAAIDSYEEVDAMLRSIDEVTQVLQGSLTALTDEKKKAEYILNNIGDGIFAVDAEKNIAFINNAACGMFGVTPEIAGKHINYLTNDKTLAAAVDDCAVHEKSSLFELALAGKIYLVTLKRLPGTALTMAVLSDVTDSRESEKQREEFFANASHELKTPLTAIKGFNELTALGNKDENMDKYIGGIARETDRMLALLGDMLALSELENTQELHPTSVSLAKTAHEVREVLSAAIGEKNMEFEIIGDGTVNADPAHVFELIKNLAENAVRYNEQGGRVSITMESDKENTWLFVYDNGIGIPPEEQTRIFERFCRVEKSRSQRSGGTGLGLSIVKHLCALYGWKLSLKSKLGVGTEVTVVFPKEGI